MFISLGAFEESLNRVNRAEIFKLVEIFQQIQPFSLFEEKFLLRVVKLGFIMQIPEGWQYDKFTQLDKFYLVINGTFEFTYEEEKKHTTKKSNKEGSVQDLKKFVIKDKQVSNLDRIRVFKLSEAGR